MIRSTQIARLDGALNTTNLHKPETDKPILLLQDLCYAPQSMTRKPKLP